MAQKSHSSKLCNIPHAFWHIDTTGFSFSLHSTLVNKYSSAILKSPTFVHCFVRKSSVCSANKSDSFCNIWHFSGPYLVLTAVAFLAIFNSSHFLCSWFLFIFILIVFPLISPSCRILRCQFMRNLTWSF